MKSFLFTVLPYNWLTQQTLLAWEWYMWKKCTESQLHHICDLIKYAMRWDTMPRATWHTPSSFKTGRHWQWWLSMLHLLHLWAQLHKQSLFGICASKGGSFGMNLSSYWSTVVWLQHLLHPYQLIVDYCKLFSYNGAVVLHACWCITIIVAIMVIVIVKWHWHLDAFNGITMLIVTLGAMLDILLLRDKDGANQR